jgi:hypothetical protein
MSVDSEESTINLGVLGNDYKTKHIKYGVQCAFGATSVVTSIVFLATGGSVSVWLPVLTGITAFFLEAPTYR